ncbi:hypothetical protein BD289DRAFT_369729 [Coniella lustricola]|uniref:Vacuolar ATPase assembly protein VMA22 n=1 Tax=Coniella lustricola TaxID=2025994 RepID=A0A2T3A665_9PEZI|nr:hypothetical protein BD289DRAFT_369729 [Coniella lustricola]
MDAPSIDDLLTRYLLLLDEYTTLRADLSRLQASAFQHLARANFAAERGARYGADQYDERMQASRTVADQGMLADAAAGIKLNEEPQPNIAKQPKDTTTMSSAQDESEKPPSPSKSPLPARTDPLRWFGVLTPFALRQTQTSAVEVVERIVPRLVTVDAAMREVEIEVRRARKRRAKKEASAAKDGDEVRQQKASVDSVNRQGVATV